MFEKDLKIKLPLSLYLKRNVGPASFYRLLEAFNGEEEIYASSPEKIKEVCPYFKDNTITEILRGPDFKEVNRQLECCHEYGIQVLFGGESQ